MAPPTEPIHAGWSQVDCPACEHTNAYTPEVAGELVTICACQKCGAVFNRITLKIVDDIAFGCGEGQL